MREMYKKVYVRDLAVIRALELEPLADALEAINRERIAYVNIDLSSLHTAITIHVDRRTIAEMEEDDDIFDMGDTCQED